MAVRSIRMRMALLYSSILLITILLVEFVSYLFVLHTLQHSLDESLRAEVSWMSKFIESQRPEQLYSGSFEEMFSQHSLVTPLRLFVQVQDGRGTILYKSANLGRDILTFKKPTGEAIDLSTLTTLTGLALRAAVHKSPSAIICVASPIERYATPAKVLFIIFLILTPAVVLFSAAGGYALARASLRPIDEITRIARRITVESLDIALPDQKSDDEVGRLTATFNEMLGRLHYALEQAKQFPANVAHELRTSLMVIRSLLDEALISDLNADQVRNMAAASLDEVNRMVNMVEALFILSKTEIDKIRQEFKLIQFDEFVAGLHWESIILAQTKKIRVTLKKLDQVRILGDEKLLRQLFLNLIDNAIKYNHERGAIYLSLERKNSHVVLVISDTGIGIPPEETQKIFERFYRTQQARAIDAEGVGLGLAIVKWIVDVHGGKISLSSTPGNGTTFMITLPIDRPMQGGGRSANNVSS